MNEPEFKQHLKDLVHGHHHPEEHDWNSEPGKSKKAAVRPKRRTAKKASKRK